nr:DUF4421 family protein [uncultured Capnocytophaga sp.]
MNLQNLLSVIIISIHTLSTLRAQERDSTYIQPYPQEMWLRTYTPTKMLILIQDKKTYSPNYPFSLGVGVGLRKILGVNLLYAQNLFLLKNDTNLKTRSLDLQAHKYGKRILIDAYYQDYTGFYINNGKGNYTLFPTLSTQQIGLESTYVWRADKFSARAAFEQSERQVKSAGSLLFGSGFYWHRIEPDAKNESVSNEAFENFQIGFHGGYAYSWVASQHWLITGSFIAGVNFGNQINTLQNLNIKIYPTTTARFSFVYLKNDWTIALSGIFNNNSIYPINNKPIRIIVPNIQLSFTKHIYFKKRICLTLLHFRKVPPTIPHIG